MNRRPQLSIMAPGASAAEAAAVVAALEHFMRETAPAPAAPSSRPNPWVRAARLEATTRGSGPPSPWGDALPWGRGS